MPGWSDRRPRLSTRADFVNVIAGGSFVRKCLIDEKNPKRMIRHVNAGASCPKKAYRGRRYLNYVKKGKRTIWALLWKWRIEESFIQEQKKGEVKVEVEKLFQATLTNSAA